MPSLYCSWAVEHVHKHLGQLFLRLTCEGVLSEELAEQECICPRQRLKPLDWSKDRIFPAIRDIIESPRLTRFGSTEIALQGQIDPVQAESEWNGWIDEVFSGIHREYPEIKQEDGCFRKRKRRAQGHRLDEEELKGTKLSDFYRRQTLQYNHLRIRGFEIPGKGNVPYVAGIL